MDEFQLNCGQRGLCAKGCGRQDKQLNTYDWLADVPGANAMSDLVEVQFKNTRKDYYVNSNHLPLQKGDIVAVESSPGHDIGVVTLTGALVTLQMKKVRLKSDAGTKRVYRLAKDIDMQKYEEAKAREHETMIKSRQIAKELNLDMKIGDVEYQGDGNKAIFYYIADQRVDFRKLIKVLAEEFRVRIEMKQIGARQEAGRIGGIGPCGRELCCATWMKNFVTVSINAARSQEVSLNPQKLAGQCAKLKCCLNYEISVYAEAAAKLPPREVQLETEKATYYYFKSDMLAGLVSYSTDKNLVENVVTIPVKRAWEIIELNRAGEKPATLTDESLSPAAAANLDLATQESLTRFDKRKKKKSKSRGKSGGQNMPPRQERKGEAAAADNRRDEAAAENGATQPNDDRKNKARSGRYRGGNRQRREQQGGDNEERKPYRDNRRSGNGAERKSGGSDKRLSQQNEA